MDETGRERAAKVYRQAMSQSGLSAADVAERGGIPDADTVRTFMDGLTWPWAKTRKKLEEAVGMEPGTLEAVARGDRDELEVGDPVVSAIERSALSRANRHRLIGTYYDMLDAQSGEVSGA